MSYYLIKNPKTASFMTIRTSSETGRYICFKDMGSARRCCNFMVRYKYDTGNWPVLDVSGDSIEVPVDKEKARRKVPTLQMQECDPQQIAQVSNSPVLLCNSFETMHNAVMLSGIEIYPINNRDVYIENLNKQIQ